MRRTFEWPLLIAYVLAAAIGCAVLFSISPDRLMQQLTAMVIGLIVIVYLSQQEAGFFSTVGWPAYVATVLMLIATLFLGENVRGSVRWINIAGFQFQASEFTKPLLIIAFAEFFHRFPLNSAKNVAINVGLFLIPVALIFKQPDLGTALVISAIWFAQYIVSGASWWVNLGMGIAAIGGGFAVPHVLHDYQLRRITSFLDPASEPQGAGYNVIQSIIAVGSGRILGKGLGHGTQSHLRFLPERHTDFVFASLAEELGLVGGLGVIAVLSFIMYRLLSAIIYVHGKQSRLIVAGIFAFFCFQTCVNIGMNIGIAPVTGITLPLISYGGSSVVATAIMLGMSSSIIKNASPDSSIEIK